jgi:hypothetical protein
MVLPGDELLPRADLTATRAVTIRVSAEHVWPWIVQLGQGRAGFYSYDILENLVGLNIHSTDRIVPEWQHVAVGDEIRLAPQVGLVVASLKQGRALVLSGGIPIRDTAPPYDFVWAFALRDELDGTTRLLVREQYAYTRPWARLLIEPTQVVSLVMSQKMLRGIRERAERTAAHDVIQADAEPILGDVPQQVETAQRPIPAVPEALESAYSGPLRGGSHPAATSRMA